MIFLIWLVYFLGLYLLQLLQVVPMWHTICTNMQAAAGAISMPGWIISAFDWLFFIGTTALHTALFVGAYHLINWLKKLLIKDKTVNTPLMKKESNTVPVFGVVTVGFTVMFGLGELGLLSRSLSGMLIPICGYIVLAVSLNLVVGISGELSLGHAGFMGVGAFTGVIISGIFRDTIDSELLRLVLAMVCGGFFAGIAGLVVGIPVLRLRGDYLAIVTLAFGEILKNIFGNLYVGKDVNGVQFAFSSEAIKLADGGKMILKGPMGASGVQKIATFPVAFVLILVTLFVVLNLINSKEGRAIKAIRDNRIAAESVGINVTAFKLKAFVTSAFLAGMAGALFALNYSSVNASQFNFNTSINILVFVVLGGMGNILGSIISTTVLYLVPELLRELQDYRMIIYAIVLIVVMLFTWSPKVIQLMQVLQVWIKDLFKKKIRKDKRGGSVNG